MRIALAEWDAAISVQFQRRAAAALLLGVTQPLEDFLVGPATRKRPLGGILADCRQRRSVIEIMLDSPTCSGKQSMRSIAMVLNGYPQHRGQAPGRFVCRLDGADRFWRDRNLFGPLLLRCLCSPLP